MIHRVSSPSRPKLRPGANGVRAVLLGLGLALSASNCTPVATPSEEPTPRERPIPSIEEGPLPRALAREAREELQEARDYLAAGIDESARETALNIIRRYPGAQGSGEALEILAQASLRLQRVQEALEASGRFLDLLDPAHPAFSRATVLRARVLAEAGDPAGALQALRGLPPVPEPRDQEEVLQVARDAAAELTLDELLTFAAEIPEGHVIQGVVSTESAVSLFLGGDREEARSRAREALAGGVPPREEELNRAILDGTLEEVLGQPVVLGAILPRSGMSPSLMEYAESILEGVQVAVEEFQGNLRRPIRLEVLDHGGDLGGGVTSMERLESLGALGAVGPLTTDLLAEVARARGEGTPVVSPFAALPPQEAPGVLSLSGPDPGGARVVARYAWDLGLESVVVLRPATEESRVPAGAFQEVFRELGGQVPREIVYDSGATFFQTQFQQVGQLLPDGLFLPLTPSDIQLLAPQFTFYGLDTLGIQLLGTTGWTEPEVVEEVDSRHTDGVVAATTRATQGETEAFRRFREAYEELFQKTLRTDVPAFGYDAAALLLQAFREGPENGRDLLTALEEIQDFPGATGILSVEEGRIVREPHLVRIQDHELIYISPRFQ